MRVRMAESLFLVLTGLAGACTWDLALGPGCPFQPEGCEVRGGNIREPLSFNGLVTSGTSGEPLVGVSILLEAPARDWIHTSRTDSTGRYWTLGPSPVAGNCDGLSISFRLEGYEPSRVTEFPNLTCGPGSYQVNVTLMPTPGG